MILRFDINKWITLNCPICSGTGISADFVVMQRDAVAGVVVGVGDEHVGGDVQEVASHSRSCPLLQSHMLLFKGRWHDALSAWVEVI